jgi:2-haloacid dehalogenase
MPAPISVIVFDVGNVLYQWSLRTLFAKLIPDADQLDWFLAHVITEEWHFQSDAGRPLADMVAERCTEFPDHAPLIQSYAERFVESIHAPVPGSLDIVAELATRGTPIYGITNFGSEFWDRFRPTAPIFDHFIDIVVSGKERLTKPDPAIYHLALHRFGLAPGTALFVDDRADNVAAAQDNGFIGHHFTDAATLRAELVAWNIL